MGPAKQKQQPMPSVLKSLQRTATVASAAVDNFGGSSAMATGVGQRGAVERQSLLGNDGMMGKGKMADQPQSGPRGSPTSAERGGGGGAPTAPRLMKMSSQHIKMKNVMESLSRRLKMHSRGESIGFRGRDMHDASGKKYRVEVPKNMLVLTLVAFFVLPLVLGLYILFRQLFQGEEVHSRYQHHPHHKHPLVAAELSNATSPQENKRGAGTGLVSKWEEETEIMNPSKIDENGDSVGENAIDSNEGDGEQDESTKIDQTKGVSEDDFNPAKLQGAPDNADKEDDGKQPEENEPREDDKFEIEDKGNEKEDDTQVEEAKIVADHKHNKAKVDTEVNDAGGKEKKSIEKDESLPAAASTIAGQAVEGSLLKEGDDTEDNQAKESIETEEAGRKSRGKSKRANAHKEDSKL